MPLLDISAIDWLFITRWCAPFLFTPDAIISLIFIVYHYLFHWFSPLTPILNIYFFAIFHSRHADAAMPWHISFSMPDIIATPLSPILPPYHWLRLRRDYISLDAAALMPPVLFSWCHWFIDFSSMPFSMRLSPDMFISFVTRYAIFAFAFADCRFWCRCSLLRRQLCRRDATHSCMPCRAMPIAIR